MITKMPNELLLFYLRIVYSSFIPNKNITILSKLTKYLYKLTNMHKSEKVDLLAK